MPKCRACKQPMVKAHSQHSVCSIQCLWEYLDAKEAKKQEREQRRREKVRAEIVEADSLKNATKRAQQAFNAYIVVRDSRMLCISCGEREGNTCGHHRTVGSSPEIRFNTKNANGQCGGCNSGQVRRQGRGETVKAKYDAAVVTRYGQSRLDWVNGPHELKQYRIEDLKRIGAIFRKRARIYKRIRGV